VSESLWLLGDQLHPAHLASAQGRRLLLIESFGRLRAAPYHSHKLVLILSAMRHVVAELQQQGAAVDLRRADDFLSGVRAHVQEYAVTRLTVIAAAEYATRQLQLTLAAELGIAVTILPNQQLLVERQPPKTIPKIMEPFYRRMRKATGLLMDAQGEPLGGRWNYDDENRKRYDGRPLPAPLLFQPDAMTLGVIADVQAWCPTAQGAAADFALPVTHAAAEQLRDDFVLRRLADFGPFEDAMSSRSRLLFHSLLSPLINIGLLDPLETAQAAVQAYHDGLAPLNSVEGFVRQIIGWREYMYLRYWELMPDLQQANAWQAERPLPAWFWHGQTEMRCLQHVLAGVHRDGYSHHIERLMVLANFATLAGIRPQEVNDWFLFSYVDAYDWVVTPNVIGMGLNADGGQIATKPYIAGGAYIERMSDYCAGCRFRPKERHGERACPFTVLYWDFLLRHETRLRRNPRLGPAVLGLARLDDAERERVQAAAAQILHEHVPLA
jgi:deoxyribodipyrimidine photolyase-related protein